MNQFALERTIVKLIQERIASNCVNGSWDWNIKHNLPIATPREVLIESIQDRDDSPLYDLIQLSALVCSDILSLHRIDNISDLEQRIYSLNAVPHTPSPCEITTLFIALHDDHEEKADPDPTTDPFYFQEHFIG
jgi:hypothetical protein